jgi:hypothetical protein
MRLYSMSQLSNEEKSNILDKHREIYNGYRRMQNEVPNEQPLYVQDFAGDKEGITLNNKGEIKKYTNIGINEQIIKGKFKKPIVSSEEMEEQEINQFESEMDEDAEICNECGGGMYEGECNECGWKGDMGEGIYDEEDLNTRDKFDYVEGVNDEDIALAMDTKDPNLALAMSEDDEPIYETMTSAFEEELDEISGPSPLYSKVDPAYEFKSDGPLQAKGPYHQNEEELEELAPEDLIKGKKYKYKSPSFEDDIEFEDEYPIGGMYGFKGDKMSHSMGGKHIEDFVSDIDIEDIDDYDERDSAFDRMKRGMGDVEDIDWEEIDEDIKESFVTQKNKINEMFNRIGRYN